MAEVQPDSAETGSLLERVARHDADALEELLVRHRLPLRDFIEFHLDPRLRARVDPSDVVQETQMELVRRMEDFLAQRPMPFRLWIRKKAYERLFQEHRSASEVVAALQADGKLDEPSRRAAFRAVLRKQAPP